MSFPTRLVKADEKSIYIIETKGMEELDVPLKMARLKQWCDDMNESHGEVRYDFIYVDEASYKKYHPKSSGDLVMSFREYKD